MSSAESMSSRFSAMKIRIDRPASSCGTRCAHRLPWISSGRFNGVVTSHKCPMRLTSNAVPSPAFVTSTHNSVWPSTGLRNERSVDNASNTSRGLGRSHHRIPNVTAADTNAAVGTTCHHSTYESLRALAAIAEGEAQQ